MSESKDVSMSSGGIDAGHPGASHASNPIPAKPNSGKVAGQNVTAPKHPVNPPAGTNPGTAVVKE